MRAACLIAVSGPDSGSLVCEWIQLPGVLLGRPVGWGVGVWGRFGGLLLGVPSERHVWQ